ncbi:MAG: hypothetical protein IPO78_17140 [Saprospiraceae bacterium]|nr:hypothetical protein [Saprospiraceae bacterium]
MIVYLAAFKSIEKDYQKDINDIYLLSSFAEHRGNKISDHVYGDRHILDSGAYSTFKNIEEAKKKDWKKYAIDYANFIKKTNQKKYFELDIDLAMGIKNVEQYRKIIEDITGVQSIQVWHKNRGIEYFYKMCESCKYVAIGGSTANSEGMTIRRNSAISKTFINIAHSKGCKIHGLGFTKTKELHTLKFDSVDSTTWLGGGKYGCHYLFTGTDIKTVALKKGMKTHDKIYKKLNIFNFDQWLQFQRYAEKKL